MIGPAPLDTATVAHLSAPTAVRRAAGATVRRWSEHGLRERAARCIGVTSEEDIVAAVRAARESGVTVRGHGSLGSKNACHATAGLALRFDGYDRVVAVDGNRVTAQAGVTVAALNAVLRGHGLALPTQGEWLGATVAGALATGVHGGSLAHGILPTSVAAIRLITADGGALDVRRGTDLFEHTAVSLGVLGITSTITFECVKTFHLELVSRVVSFAQYQREHAAAARDHEFYSATWIPTARRVVTYAAIRVPSPMTPVPRRERYSLATLVLSALSRRLDVHAFPRRWFERVAVDAADRILTPIGSGSRQIRLLQGLTRHWREAEFAVPLDAAGETLAALDELCARHPRVLTLPIGLRASAADGLSLSPCFGRPTFWVSVFFRERDGFGGALRSVFESRGARLHWGKHVELSPDHLRRQYPRWSAFRDARRALDPDGTFANAFTRRLGL